MHPADYWFAAAILALALALWAVVPDRNRLRAAFGMLALWAAILASILLPASWRPGDIVIASTGAALLEAAAIQIVVVIVFDVLMRKIQIPKFAMETLIVGSYAAVLFNLLYRVGVNVTGIFATSAVAAAVVGLALQDMLSNVAGGIALELENVIRPGDFIHVGEWSGWVQHVRLRHTAITSSEGDTVLLTNSQITRSALTIFSSAHRHFIPFAMPYALDPHELISTVEVALRASPIPGIATDPAPSCLVREMTPGHVGYAAVIWFTRPGPHEAEISAVLMRIYFALQRAGIPASEISTLVELRQEAKSMATPNPVDVLRRTPILRLMPDPDLIELASHLEHLSFAAGEHIIRQGEEGDSMYFVVAGEVEIFFRSEDGEERRLSHMEPGDFFGEASLLTGEARNASAVALSRVDCYRLEKSGLHGFIQRLPELAEDMSVVLAHRQMQLDSVREKLDRETALRREAESQNEFLKRIRRFFAT